MSAPGPVARALPPRPGPHADARAGRARLTSIARAALLVAGALPWLLPFGRRYLPLGVAGAWLDALFVPLCHRLPERTIALAGAPMPLCSRCAGIAAGLTLGALLADARPRLPLARLRELVGVGLALMAIDAIAQGAGLYPLEHPTRLASGALFGYALARAWLAALGGAASMPSATCDHPSGGTR